MAAATVEHSIENVRIEVHDKNFVVVCGCGWASQPAEAVRSAVADWKQHRDDLS